MAETPGSALQRLAAATGGVVTPANVVVTGYDLLRNAEPGVFPDRRAKWAMMTSATGMGVQVAATNAERTHPRLAGVLHACGAISSFGGVTFLGIPTTAGTGRPPAAGQAGAGQHPTAWRPSARRSDVILGIDVR